MHRAEEIGFPEVPQYSKGAKVSSQFTSMVDAWTDGGHWSDNRPNVKRNVVDIKGNRQPSKERTKSPHPCD
jgi:hypothetical protein